LLARSSKRFFKSAKEGPTKEQSNGVLENLATVKVAEDRSAYEDQHARIIIMARSKPSN